MAARPLSELQKRYNQVASAGKGPGFGPPGRPGRGRPGIRPKGKPGNTKSVIKRLWKYVSAYKFRLLLVFVFMAVSTVTSLIGSYIMRPIINNIAAADTPASDRIAYLGKILILMIIIYLVGILASYLQQRLMITVSQSATEKLRNDLFVSMEALPVRFFDGETTGSIMSRFTNDVDNIDMMLSNTLVQLVSGVITLVGTLSFMIYTNWVLTLVTAAFVPLLLLMTKFIAGRSGKYYSAQQAALGAVNGYIEETVSGQKVVKVFNHEKECIEEFNELNEDMRQKQFGAAFFGGIMGPVLGNTTQVCYAVIAGIGGLMCLTGKFDIGGISIFANYSRQFSQPVNMLAQQTSTIFSALAGAERVFAIMDKKPENADDAPNSSIKNITGVVELKNVYFGYNKDKTILKNISLVASTGKKIAFVGSTGAGKTTITNLINRFYDIDEGEILIDNINIKDYSRAFLRENIAMVLQDTHLFTGSVKDNIRYSRPDATDEEIIAAAKTAGAHSFIMRLSSKYDTVLEQDGANLSQGQRQLINIARAALSKAPILILDEATSSVDTRTERHIEHGMDRLMKNRTTFVIAHRLSTIRNADLICVLEKGEITERGSHEQLLALNGRYYELYTGKKELD